jgi:hypothetical protein
VTHLDDGEIHGFEVNGFDLIEIAEALARTGIDEGFSIVLFDWLWKI